MYTFKDIINYIFNNKPLTYNTYNIITEVSAIIFIFRLNTAGLNIINYGIKYYKASNNLIGEAPNSISNKYYK